jgi:hypothetical protein
LCLAANCVVCFVSSSSSSSPLQPFAIWSRARAAGSLCTPTQRPHLVHPDSLAPAVHTHSPAVLFIFIHSPHVSRTLGTRFVAEALAVNTTVMKLEMPMVLVGPEGLSCLSILILCALLCLIRSLCACAGDAHGPRWARGPVARSSAVPLVFVLLLILCALPCLIRS